MIQWIWITNPKFFTRFFLWRSFGLAALSTGNKDAGNFRDWGFNRVSFLNSIDSNHLRPVASSNFDLLTIIFSSFIYICCNSSHINGSMGLSVWKSCISASCVFVHLALQLMYPLMLVEIPYWLLLFLLMFVFDNLGLDGSSSAESREEACLD